MEKKDIYLVGVYIDDEFTIFAICTNYKSATKAARLLTQNEWEDVVIERSQLHLDFIEIEGEEIDLNIE